MHGVVNVIQGEAPRSIGWRRAGNQLGPLVPFGQRGIRLSNNEPFFAGYVTRFNRFSVVEYETFYGLM
jgi:hypothetical protein